MDKYTERTTKNTYKKRQHRAKLCRRPCLVVPPRVLTGGQPHRTPPPSRSCRRGRWWWPNRGRKPTSVSLLYAREVVGPERVRNPINIHLRLAFAREGGGGGANAVESPDMPPPSRSCMRGRWRALERGQTGEGRGEGAERGRSLVPPSRSCMRGRWPGLEQARTGEGDGRGRKWARSRLKNHLRVALAHEGGGGGKGFCRGSLL